MYDAHPSRAIPIGELVGYIASAVWRIVICHHDPQAGQRQTE
jgi:hypothetical protein